MTEIARYNVEIRDLQTEELVYGDSLATTDGERAATAIVQDALTVLRRIRIDSQYRVIAKRNFEHLPSYQVTDTPRNILNINERIQ